MISRVLINLSTPATNRNTAAQNAVAELSKSSLWPMTRQKEGGAAGRI